MAATSEIRAADLADHFRARFWVLEPPQHLSRSQFELVSIAGGQEEKALLISVIERGVQLRLTASPLPDEGKWNISVRHGSGLSRIRVDDPFSEQGFLDNSPPRKSGSLLVLLEQLGQVRDPPETCIAGKFSQATEQPTIVVGRQSDESSP